MTESGLILRPSQERILNYQSGKMGISAVPGSGKTWTLSYLAAKIITSGKIKDNQEVLIVTLVNSAVDNFSRRISQRLKEEGLLPNLGYRVRTLHGLAHDIVRERPDLANLNTDFSIIDEREANSIKSIVSQTFLRTNPDFLTRYLDDQIQGNKLNYLYKKDIPALVNDLTNIFIRTAKDYQLSPVKLIEEYKNSNMSLPFVEMGIQLYQDYQQALNYRGGVDFDDLIRLALQCLQSDPFLVESLQARWPFILEDEAQDSSQLQQKILAVLSGTTGNWVRVGDPNQAIYETFTTANPRLLREFIARKDVTAENLPESGRSSQSIISLANFLIDWTRKDHPNNQAKDSLSLPHIQPTPADDPQPNPKDDPTLIDFNEKKFTPEAELNWVLLDVQNWLTQNPDSTIAILAPRNARAQEMIDRLIAANIPVVDSLLSSTTDTRLSTGAVANILRYLSDPQSATKLATAYKVWQRKDPDEEDHNYSVKSISTQIKKCNRTEDYLWPQGDDTWLDSFSDDPNIHNKLSAFRDVVRRWQGAILLPIDQLLLTLSQDLFLDPVELALAHKLAVTLRQMSNAHPGWQLNELTDELAIIAKNERRFLGFSEDEYGFNPEQHKGKVVVATMHKAKGLEWDKVYLMSVNNYDFPSGNEFDSYFSEKWFIRNDLNLEAETKAQLEVFLNMDTSVYIEGEASKLARDEYIRERLRLLFVGITRACKSLTLTLNTGKTGNVQEAIPLIALRNYWNLKKHETSE